MRSHFQALKRLTFNMGFNTVNLHRPTERSGDVLVLEVVDCLGRGAAVGLDEAAQVEFESKV
jgi:hypothetical protein